MAREAEAANPEEYRAFWSYVHADDEDEGGRISQLAGLVARRVRLLTASPFPIFLDHEGIEWGQRWEITIDDALLSTKFFVPILTPSYFESAACREELVKFAGAAQSLGLKELIMPVYYVDIPDFAPGVTSSDELVELVKSFQYEDWRDVALDDVGFSGHRKAVHRLALALKGRAEEADRKPVKGGGEGGGRPPRSPHDGRPPTSIDPASGAVNILVPDESEAPGTIDILADGEEAIGRLAETMTKIPPLMQRLSDAAEEGTRQIERSDRQKAGFAGRLVAARNFANAIEGPAEEVNELAGDFLKDLLKVDPMIRELARLGAEEEGELPEEFIGMFEAINTMIAEAEGGLGEMENLAGVIVDSTKWSKEMRRPSRRLVEGLRQFADARSIFRSWQPVVDSVLQAGTTDVPVDDELAD